MLCSRRIRTHNKRNIIVLELNYGDMLMGRPVTWLELNNDSGDYIISHFSHLLYLLRIKDLS